MQTPSSHMAQQWWASGDTPVRNDSRVTYMADGRAVMLTMCRHFLKARHYIYLANWGMTPAMELIRGRDRLQEPGDGPWKEALIAELKAEGLTDADIAFWFSHELSLRNVLQYAISKGVEVKALLWKTSPFFSHYNLTETYEQLQAAGVICLLDSSAEGILHHPIESLHQKITIVDGLYAFVGGVDPLIEKGGEYDRWDTPDHAYTTPLRQTHSHTTPHPWHDAHAFIEGPAVSDVEFNFRQRWNDVIEHHHHDHTWLIPQHPLPAPLTTSTITQVARTIPEHTYHFEPKIIRGIAQLYANAFHNIRRFVYLENQYFWLRAYFGVDLPLMGTDSPEMEHNIRELGQALQNGALLSIILPDHPNVGRAFTDAGLARLRDEAPQAVEEGRLQAFCLASSGEIDGKVHYRPIYVHAKVAIIDDLWTTVGSGNLNNRGMADDTEMNVATLDPHLAYHFRLILQAEHLGLATADDLYLLTRFLYGYQQSPTQQKRSQELLSSLEQLLHDPLAALKLMHEHAWANLRRYQQNELLVGHLLPYLTAAEAQQLGLNFQEEHGWIEEPSQ